MNTFRVRVFLEEPGFYRAEVTFKTGRSYTGWGLSPLSAEINAQEYGRIVERAILS